jgi:ligand-binding sensor domain-containing protein
MKEVLMVVTLCLDPTRPAMLYAGTSGGVYRSVDRAGHWEKANNGLVAPEMVKSSRALNVTAVQVDAFAPDTVYAATLSGLYKSVDTGKSWTRIGESLQDQMIITMVLDRTRKGVIYLAGREGITRSEDGGVTWKSLNEGLTTKNIRSLAQSPSDAAVWYAGTNGSGLYRSRNHGELWEKMPAIKVVE